MKSIKKPLSKNKRRRLRRENYYCSLDASLEDEGRFVRRVIATLDHQGLDIAPDGRPIKANFWGFIRQRMEASERSRNEQTQRDLANSSLACLDLVERAVNTLTVQNCRTKASH